MGNMKFLLVVALFAGVRAEAEADPQLLVHSPFVYGLAAHHAVPHVPVVKSVEVKPAVVKTTPVVTYLHAPYFGLWGHGLPVVGAPAAATEADAPAVEEAERKKREAEAEPEADPYYLTYGIHRPVVYTTTPVVKPIVKKVEVKAPVVTYATHHVLPYTHGYGYPYSYGYHGYPYVVTKPVEAEAEAEAVEAERKKREAEADPEADPYYLTYGVHRPYVYHPYVYTTPVVKPAVKTADVKAPAVNYAYHHALPYAYGYPYTYGYHPYVVKPVEAEAEAVEAERKKRDADADPAILASSTIVKTPVTTYTHPLTYTTLPYATHGVYANYGYPYAHHALPYTYRGVYHPYTYGYPYVVTKPVEAEAEAVDAERK